MKSHFLKNGLVKFLPLAFILTISCSNEDFFFEIEDYSYLQIAETQEYKVFLESILKFQQAFMTPDSTKMEQQVVNGHIIYISSTETLDSLMNVYNQKLDILQQKHPQYSSLTEEKKQELIVYASQLFPELENDIIGHKVFVRTKCLNREIAFKIKNKQYKVFQGAKFTVNACNNEASAHIDAYTNCYNTATECAGYTFEDGSVLVFYDNLKNGTNTSSMRLPLFEFDYQPTSFFHYHPWADRTGVLEYSGDDINALDSLFKTYGTIDTHIWYGRYGEASPSAK